MNEVQTRSKIGKVMNILVHIGPQKVCNMHQVNSRFKYMSVFKKCFPTMQVILLNTRVRKDFSFFYFILYIHTYVKFSRVQCITTEIQLTFGNMQ